MQGGPPTTNEWCITVYPSSDRVLELRAITKILLSFLNMHTQKTKHKKHLQKAE
jgi:hypothetical protein